MNGPLGPRKRARGQFGRLANRSSKREFIVIEREFQIQVADDSFLTQSETIVRVPKKSGLYDTQVGELDILVCPIGKDPTIQKIVFIGKIVESMSRLGNCLKRSVKFPDSLKPVRHHITPTETLLFRIEK